MIRKLNNQQINEKKAVTHKRSPQVANIYVDIFSMAKETIQIKELYIQSKEL